MKDSSMKRRMNEPTCIPRLSPPFEDTETGDLYDYLVSTRASTRDSGWLVHGDGHLLGPFNTLLHTPLLGKAVASLGETLRYHGTLSDRVREATILAVAASRCSYYEWTVHESLGRGAGLIDEDLSRLKEGDRPNFDSDLEGAIFDIGKRLIDGAPMDGAVPVHSQIAVPEVIEITVLVAYYNLLATLMEIVGADLPVDVHVGGSV